MSIEGFISHQLSNKAARNLLSLMYKDNRLYTLIFGRLKGAKLLYRKDVNLRVMLGLWEMDSISMLMRVFNHFEMLGKDLIVADIGANIGYYSMFFSRYLSPQSRIFAFEPSTSILPLLKKNIEVNKIRNVDIQDLACSNHTGTEEFFIGQHHHQSSLVGDWSRNSTVGTRAIVNTTTLDDFFAEQNNHKYPDLIKMDIEGGGVFALKGCDQCIVRKRPFIIIESHTPSEDQAIIDVLQKYNYEALRVDTDKWVLNKKANYKDKSGVWGTMLLVPAEKRKGFSERSL
jgi:FkbM family methyltransferase